MDSENEQRPETYFHGPKEEWLSILPEETLDEVIKLLDINPDKKTNPGFKLFKRTVKDDLWNDLTLIIRAWGRPPASKLGINSKSLRDEAQNTEEKLSKALELLNDLNYGPLFEKGTMTKEFEIAHKIRQKSGKKDSDKDKGITDLYRKQKYEETGEWGQYYIFDYELSDAIKNLERIHSYVADVKCDLISDTKGRGEEKDSNIRRDTLIIELCKIYKKYTGKSPAAYYTGDHDYTPKKVSGDIIPFLQKILPHANFKRKMSGFALEKRLRSLRQNPAYKELLDKTTKS